MEATKVLLCRCGDAYMPYHSPAMMFFPMSQECLACDCQGFELPEEGKSEEDHG